MPDGTKWSVISVWVLSLVWPMCYSSVACLRVLLTLPTKHYMASITTGGFWITLVLFRALLLIFSLLGPWTKRRDKVTEAELARRRKYSTWRKERESKQKDKKEKGKKKAQKKPDEADSSGADWASQATSTSCFHTALMEASLTQLVMLHLVAIKSCGSLHLPFFAVAILLSPLPFPPSPSVSWKGSTAVKFQLKQLFEGHTESMHYYREKVDKHEIETQGGIPF